MTRLLIPGGVKLRLMQAGLQLYSVTGELHEDFEGTLAKLPAIGIHEVELAGLYDRKPEQLRRTFDDLGLVCRSGHLVHFWEPAIEATLEAAHALGLRYLVAPCPWKRDLTGITPDPEEGPYAFAVAVLNSLTLEDWKWNADLLNATGERIRTAGFQFVYHNHNFEFTNFDGRRGFDEMLRLTDPNLVKLELDPGWMRVSGADPLEYLTNQAGRVALMHVRDFAPGFTQTTRLSLSSPPAPASPNHGSVGFAELLPAAIRAGVQAFYLEREPVPENLSRIAQDVACIAPWISPPG